MEAIWAWLEPWCEPWVCANKTSVDLPSLRKPVVFLGMYPRNCIWSTDTIINDCCRDSDETVLALLLALYLCNNPGKECKKWTMKKASAELSTGVQWVLAQSSFNLSLMFRNFHLCHDAQQSWEHNLKLRGVFSATKLQWLSGGAERGVRLWWSIPLATLQGLTVFLRWKGIVHWAP